MAIKDLTHNQATVLLARIASSLEHTEDARDFCLWLAETLNEEANLDINLLTNNLKH